MAAAEPPVTYREPGRDGGGAPEPAACRLEAAVCHSEAFDDESFDRLCEALDRLPAELAQLEQIANETAGGACFSPRTMRSRSSPTRPRISLGTRCVVFAKRIFAVGRFCETDSSSFS